MSFELPPVVKQAERVMLDVEQIVRYFPRYHKYTIGTQMREQAMKVWKLCHRVWRDKPNRAEWMNKLVFAVDDFKLSLQLAKQVHAFKSFAQFEALAKEVSNLGSQCGAMKRNQQGNGQNVPGYRAQEQRPQKLSARSASGEARL